jgi:hypothetical protein
MANACVLAGSSKGPPRFLYFMECIAARQRAEARASVPALRACSRVL